MSASTTRYTPLVGPLGTQTLTLPGTTELLSTLLTIPREAAQCLVQGVGRTLFAYRIDGSEGEAAADCLVANEAIMSNRTDLDQLVLCANGGATECVVQFFNGTVGP